MLILFLFATSCGGGSSDQEKDGQEREAKERSKAEEALTSFGIDTAHGVPQGLHIGEQAPSFASLTDRGDTVRLEELLSEGPLLLFFYRGQWCPLCNRTLKQYADSLDRVRERGASVLAVTPESTKNVQKTRSKSGTKVRIVPDTAHRIMKAYKVRFRVTDAYSEKIAKKLGTDIATNNADSAAYLPVPATYLIDREGKVVWRHFDPDYHERSSVRSILRALDENL